MKVNTLPLTQESGLAALFVCNGQFATITLSRVVIVSTEDVVNFPGWSYGRVIFGTTWFRNYNPALRSIYAVNANYGWNHAGNGGIVSRSHTYGVDGTSVRWYGNSPQRIIFLD